MPDQMKLDYALWVGKVVMELVSQETGADLSILSVGSYLAGWGFTPQKPTRRVYEQSPAEVEQWLREDCPAIIEKAKSEDAEFYWGDETGIRSDSRHGRGYAPVGKTPVIRLNARRESTDMIQSSKIKEMIAFRSIWDDEWRSFDWIYETINQRCGAQGDSDSGHSASAPCRGR